MTVSTVPDTGKTHAHRLEKRLTERRLLEHARSWVGLPFVMQIAAAITALGLVQSYLARGERLFESRWREGILPFRLAPIEPADIMAAGQRKEQIALRAHADP